MNNEREEKEILMITRSETKLGVLDQGVSNLSSDFLKSSEEKEQKILLMEELKKIAKETGEIILYHGGLSDETTKDSIDLNRNGTQQNKKGRTYGGFYLTDETSKSWTDQYARERNGNVHGFLMSKSSRVLEKSEGNTDRLSQNERDEFSKNFDLIKGKDLLGRVQYVLLNKEIIKEMGIEKIK